MDLRFTEDFTQILLLSLAFGAAGGLLWDIGSAIRPRANSTGLDNRLTLPSLKARDIDLGLIGPILMGAGVGFLTVLIAGRSGPDGEAVVRELANIASASDQGKAADAAAKALATTVDKSTLALLAMLGGVAGWPLLQLFTKRLTGLFDAVVENAAKTGGDAAAQAVAQKADELSVDPTKRAELAAAAQTAVKTAVVGTAPDR